MKTNSQNRDPKDWIKGDLIVTWFCSILTFSFICLFAILYEDKEHVALILLMGVFGASIGWFSGILATPYNREEKKRLSGISKLIYGFLTGYFFSKVDPLITAILNPESPQISERFWVFLCVAISGFIAAFVATYINRSYWLGSMSRKNGAMQLSSDKEIENENKSSSD